MLAEWHGAGISSPAKRGRQSSSQLKPGAAKRPKSDFLADTGGTMTRQSDGRVFSRGGEYRAGGRLVRAFVVEDPDEPRPAEVVSYCRECAEREFGETSSASC